jgi:hypothetical protein
LKTQPLIAEERLLVLKTEIVETRTEESKTRRSGDMTALS